MATAGMFPVRHTSPGAAFNPFDSCRRHHTQHNPASCRYAGTHRRDGAALARRLALLRGGARARHGQPGGLDQTQYPPYRYTHPHTGLCVPYPAKASPQRPGRSSSAPSRRLRPAPASAHLLSPQAGRTRRPITPAPCCPSTCLSTSMLLVTVAPNTRVLPSCAPLQHIQVRHNHPPTDETCAPPCLPYREPGPKHTPHSHGLELPTPKHPQSQSLWLYPPHLRVLPLHFSHEPFVL